MTIKGDLSQLGNLAENLAELARVPSQASRELATEIKDLIDAQFESGTDPYGRPWASKKDGGASHLTESQDLRNSIEVRPASGAGIEITIGSEYGVFHQVGTARMPARPILPEREMPDSWALAIETAVDNAAARILKNR